VADDTEKDINALTPEEAHALLKPYWGKQGLYREELGDWGEQLLWKAAEGSPTNAVRIVDYSPQSKGNISVRWRKLGLPIHRRWGNAAEHNREEPEQEELPEPIDDFAARAQFHEREADRLRKELDKFREAYAVLADIIHSEVRRLPPVKPRYKLPRTKSVDEELCMLHVADVHIGEWVRREQVAGLEEYNKDVFLERKERFQEGIESILNGHVRKTWPVKHCFLHMYGDMTTHEAIFEGQAFRIDQHLTEQIVWGAHQMADLVRFLASIFETVTVYEVEGNHGKTKGTTLNTDWLLYYIMNCALEEQANVTTNLSDGPYLGYFIDDTLGLLDYSKGGKRWNTVICHGHQAKRYAGVPYYGLDRLKMRLDSLFGVVWDMMRVGHHHVEGRGQGWELVPSWVGATDYSIGMGYASRPRQLMNGFHPRKGETWKFEIDLADKFNINEVAIEEGSNVLTPHDRFAQTREAEE